MKITIDRLTEEQMKDIRQYLNSSVNVARSEGKVFYGNYVTVEAAASHVSIMDGKVHGYDNVTFSSNSVGLRNVYTEKRAAEHNLVVSGLLELLAKQMHVKVR